jgi:uncharacterized tellurite resistance protein B-like protein
MLNKIKDFFTEKISIDKDSSGLDIDRKIQIATCALLIEMASIDEEFNEDEKKRIISYFKANFGLGDIEVAELFELASRELSDSIDLWSFTSLINQNYSADQKLKVIEAIWEVIFADGALTAHEDYLVHKLYKMLELPHAKMIDVKLKVMEKNRRQ